MSAIRGTPVVKSSVKPGFDAADPVPRIGLILLATDLTSEIEFARHCPPDEASVYAARIPYENPTTPENLRLMEPRLEEGAALLLPGEPLDAIYYACTAATVVIGETPIRDAIQRGKPGTPVVTPPGAALHAFRALGVRKISILTPYTAATSEPVADWFAAHDVDVCSLTFMDIEDDRQMARMSRDAIIGAAVKAVSPDAEALFVSCTALRSVAAVSTIERETGIPTVTSNLAALWLTRHLAGIGAPKPEMGRLFALSELPDFPEVSP